MATKAKKRREARYASAKDAAKGMQGGFTPTTFTVPEGMELLRFPKEKKTKKYHLDHMPFVVGKGNPADGVEEGDAYWERTFFVHKGFGLPQQFTCNRLTFNKPCAACKKRAKLAASEDADEDLLQEMGPKKRMLMLTRCKEMKDKGTMLQEEAYYKSYGEMVKQAIDEADDDGPAARFFHLKGGATAVVKVKQDTYNGREYMKITDVEFEDREKDYKESLLDEMPCLDDLIIPADQDELKEALEGGDEDDDDEDEDDKPKKSKKGKAQKKAKDEEEDEDDDEEDEGEDDDSDDDDADEEEEDDEEDEEEDGGDDEDEDEADDDEEAGLEKGMTVKHKKHGECEVVKVNKDGDVVTLKDEDGDEHRGVKAAECKAVEKEEDEEDEEDEDEDEDEEDEDGEADIEVGSVVEYVYKKKKRKGEVTKIKKNLVTIEEEGGETRHMKMDELSLAETDDDDEEEEKPKKKAKKSKKAKDDEDDDDDEDDIPFEEDEEDDDDEEEEKPKKKKSKRK